MRIDQSLLDEFVEIAKTDSSNLVHLALASTLQRILFSQRVDLAMPLVARSANAEDHNLPLLIWNGLIPVGPTIITCPTRSFIIRMKTNFQTLTITLLIPLCPAWKGKPF
jgi:hypothetical protein